MKFILKNKKGFTSVETLPSKMGWGTPSSQKFLTGFILPFSVMLGVITLSLGFTIFSVAYKEFVLTTINRDSQFAFYSSDTGIECALYWDLHPTVEIFPTSTSDLTTFINSAKTCTGQDITIPGSPSFAVEDRSANAATTSFTISFGNGVCAGVIVAKNFPTTTVESKGYNRCSASDNRRLERAIRYRY